MTTSASPQVWVNGRAATVVDARDRGLQYGDGLFETLRIQDGKLRLLDYHLERLQEGCRRLALPLPDLEVLRPELERLARQRPAGVLKLILTRGVGVRGYQMPTPVRTTRIVTLHGLPPSVEQLARQAARLRLCATPLAVNAKLAGLKTLNRLESVLARAEWRDPGIWEGLMQDVDGFLVCGTMSNLFARRGAELLTPRLDRCGVAGVMRRWVLEQARALRLRCGVRRLRWEDLMHAEEVFMTNAVVGIAPVGSIQAGRRRIRLALHDTAAALQARLRLL